jgi:glycerol uptake facilitator-like aquaporin
VNATRATLARRLVAELIGTALLLIAIVGSGITGERLAAGNMALALLTNSVSTGAALVAIILAFGSVSGAHLNPAVSLAAAYARGLRWTDAVAYTGVQVLGAIGGVVIAHGMFGEPLIAAGTQVRSGVGQWLGEFVATFGLLAVVWGCSRTASATVAFAVGTYIGAACLFTVSTSFANPAVTIARALTDTFSGIRMLDVPAFVAAQIVGALAATLSFAWLVPSLPSRARSVVQPREGGHT